MGKSKATLELIPLDLELLRALPDEGTMLGGLMPLSATVAVLKTKETFTGLTADTISGRLRTMKFHGLTIDVVSLPVSNGRGWQCTPAGREKLAELGT